MNLDDLKTELQDTRSSIQSHEALDQMTQANRHPVLGSIRRQLFIESLGFAALLAIYYNAFDGHLRSPLWNGLLILGLLAILAHNFLGYGLTSNPINGSNVLSSMENYLAKLRQYSLLSIGSRVVGISLVFAYFLSGVAEWTDRHSWSIVLALLIMGIQVFILHKVWKNRIQKIALGYQQLAAS